MPSSEKKETDLKSHPLSTPHDLYTLLSLPPTAPHSQIPRAYRKAALKYHPDKLSTLPSTTEKESALEKFHLLQIAYDVLSDPAVRELYDNARRAREAKKEREGLLEGRRRGMKEDLERREGEAVGKRKRAGDGDGEGDAEEVFERELRRLAEDGRRRRMEREEVLRREGEEIGREEREDGGSGVSVPGGAGANGNGNGHGEISHLSRSITLRFLQNDKTKDFDKALLISRFSKFGEIEDAVLRDKKIKLEGRKHRRLYTVAVLVYKSVVGAHAAVTDFPRLCEREPEMWADFEEVGWAGGREPDFVPKSSSFARPGDGDNTESRMRFDPDAASPARANGDAEGGRKAPSFGSFKTTATSRTAGGGRPSLDEITMMRLKNAERKRMEQKILREDAGAAAAEAAGESDDR